jgi:hypothetical protein
MARTRPSHVRIDDAGWHLSFFADPKGLTTRLTIIGPLDQRAVQGGAGAVGVASSAAFILLLLLLLLLLPRLPSVVPPITPPLPHPAPFPYLPHSPISLPVLLFLLFPEVYLLAHHTYPSHLSESPIRVTRAMRIVGPTAGGAEEEEAPAGACMMEPALLVRV